MENFYDKTVFIVQDYLGPAAVRFVDKQISFHLNREDKRIEKDEVMRVNEWMRVGLGLITQDKNLVNECFSRIEAIIK